MKAILALTTMALVALTLEDKARQVAEEAHDAYGDAVDEARRTKELVSQRVQQKPLVAILLAGGAGYGLAALLPRRTQKSRTRR